MRVSEIRERAAAWLKIALERSKVAALWLKERAKRIPRPVLVIGGTALVVTLVSVFLVVGYYARVVTKTMAGRRFSLPTRLLSDAWVVRPGDALSPDDVLRRLARLRYVLDETPDVATGKVFAKASRLFVGVNDRETPWGKFRGFRAEIDFSGRRVAAVKRAEDGASLPFVVFEPEVVGSVFDRKMEDRTFVSLDRVPKVLVDAILATEDRDFFSHSGLSFRRLGGAFVQGVFRRRGFRGTSTLTQQLVKNLFLSPERKLKRKAIEALMALIVESKYSKKEILETYLNEIYLGQRGAISVTGVEEASRFYFGKSVGNLSLPEAALLAGMIASPGRFSPFRSPEHARERRAVVLKGMLDEKKIDEPSYKAALEAPLTAVTKPAAGIVAPHFVDFVLSQVKES
ncbi:MAG TPA: transglycosylase domain-containing protein, partial [Thermoanaerobaculia bacterium]|nr:transglycosylase domain-containing protein [Thermoanaerobaculia bacterium]